MPDTKDKLLFRSNLGDGHERRILKLEEDIDDIKTITATNTTALTYIAERLDDGFVRLEKNQDAGFAQIQKRLDENDVKLEELTEVVGDHTRKLKTIDEEKQRAAERWSSLKKWAAASVAGALAVAIKELVVYVAHFWS